MAHTTTRQTLCAACRAFLAGHNPSEQVLLDRAALTRLTDADLATRLAIADRLALHADTMSRACSVCAREVPQGVAMTNLNIVALASVRLQLGQEQLRRLEAAVAGRRPAPPPAPPAGVAATDTTTPVTRSWCSVL